MINREIRQKIKEYEAQLRMEERAKKTLISAKTDFTFLEALIQKCNDNPNLRINVTLSDGTTMALSTYKPDSSHKDLINGIEEWR